MDDAAQIDTPDERRRLLTPERLAALLAVGLAIACYLNTLDGAFVFDDFGLVTGNPAFPGATVWTWFGQETTHGSIYRPLTMLTYEANAALGDGPFGYHVVNVVLHALATLAAFGLARALFGALWPAAAVAVLFAVHPIHTEPVANIAGRAEVLAGLCVLTALWALARAVPNRRDVRFGLLALSTLAAFLGMLSKESAMTVVPLAALFLCWRPHGLAWRKRALLVLPFVGAAAVCVALRWLVVGVVGQRLPAPFLDNPLGQVDVWQRIGTAIVVLGEYVSTIALPVRLSADESFDQVPVVTSFDDPRLLLTLFAAIGLVGLLVVRLPRSRWLAFGALFFLVALGVTSNVLMAIGTIKAERMLYLPSLGWCVVLAAVLVRMETRQRTIVLATLVALLGARTVVRNRVWHDSLSLFEATVADSPRSARAHGNLAAVYAGASRWDDALWHYQQAVEIHPEWTTAQIGVGHLKRMSGHIPEAMAAFRAAAAGQPDPWRGNLALGDLFVRTGDVVQAEAAYADGVEAAPGNVELLLALAATQARRGDTAAAVEIRDRFAAVAGGSPNLQRRFAALNAALAP